TRHLALVHEGSDLTVVELEDVAEKKDRALGRREPLKDDEECHRYLIERFDRLHARPPEIYGLRQTIASALLAARTCGVELVEAKPSDDGDQKGLRVLDALGMALPSQPSLLNHVFGAPQISEHAIGKGHERSSMRFEDGERVVQLRLSMEHTLKTAQP